jgi:hypothetical protein
MMMGRKLGKAIVNPLMIFVLLAIGWGPALFVEVFTAFRPDLNGWGVGVAMVWVPVTFRCTILVVAYVVGHATWLVFKFARDSLDRRHRRNTPRLDQ